jgi:hypothetical protein
MDGGCEGGNEFASELTVTGLTAGNTYYIQTDGWEGEIGEFEIQVTEFIVGVENTSADQVEFFPNPARDIISIRGAQGYSRVEIRDLQGKILTSENLNATRTVSLDGLSSGIYTITLIDQTQTRTGKLIIE